MRRDEFPIIDKAIDDAIKLERNRWIDILYDLREEMRQEHERLFALEDFDTCMGLSLGMEMIQKVIKKEMRGAEDEKK